MAKTSKERGFLNGDISKAVTSWRSATAIIGFRKLVHESISGGGGFERLCTSCLVAKLRGYCLAFSAVSQETCDRREVARLVFRTVTGSVLRLVKKARDSIFSPYRQS